MSPPELGAVPENALPVSFADSLETIGRMDVAIIDVGSNSVRLLVAAVKGGDVDQLNRERVYLRLGDDVHTLGRVGRKKLDELGEIGTTFARTARKAHVDRLMTVVTAPGRQASNSDELVEILAEATGATVVVLTANDEGGLAWEGAVSRMVDPPEVVGVVDLGGGSCEVAVGSPGLGPAWVDSREAGSLRVTRSFLDAPQPSAEAIAIARREVSFLLDGLDAPRPDVALAVGGTARAAGRILGKRFGVGQLEELVNRLAKEGAAEVTKGHGITEGRTQTLLAGALVLAEVARRLGADLEVGRGGLREGAALALAGAESAAA